MLLLVFLVGLFHRLSPWAVSTVHRREVLICACGYLGSGGQYLLLTGKWLGLLKFHIHMQLRSPSCAFYRDFLKDSRTLFLRSLPLAAPRVERNKLR